MLAGNAKETRTNIGPPLLTENEVSTPMLNAGLTLVSLEETRFDVTSCYGNLPPLAWKAVFVASHSVKN